MKVLESIEIHGKCLSVLATEKETNKAYRAIYIQNKDGEIELVTIIEVNKHKY